MIKWKPMEDTLYNVKFVLTLHSVQLLISTVGWVMETQCRQIMAGTSFSFDLIYFMGKKRHKQVLGQKSRNRPAH